MTLPTPFNGAKQKTNGSRTGLLRKAARQFRRRHYLMAKTQLEIKKIWHTVRKDEWQRIADELADVLLQGWDQKTEEAINEAIGLIRRGDQEPSRDELVKVMSQIREKLGPQFADDVAQPLMEIQAAAYKKGMEEVVEFKPTFKLIDKQATKWLQENHVYWVRNYFDRQVEETIAEVGQRVLEEGLGRREAAFAFERAFGDQVDPQSFRYWEGFANHVTTRSREFGRVEGYVRAGVTHIEIDAVLDHRTSTICRHMNGRIIKVEDAVSLRTKMMNAQKPEDVVEIAPFMKPDDVLGTPTSQLSETSPGFALPPYHYDCRTRTRKRRSVSERNTVTEVELGDQVSSDHADVLNDLTHEEHSNVLEMIRSKSQLAYNSNDFESDWHKHAPNFPDIDTKKQYRLAATRNVKEASRITSHIYKGEKQFRFFGPDGITVVDGGAQVRGFFYHESSEALDDSFEALMHESIWLKTSE